MLIGIPCFNEEQRILSVLESIPKRLKGIAQISCIVIDDGSSDNTKPIASNFGVEVISNKRNAGLGKVYEQLVTIAQERDVDFLVTMDGDGQFDGNEITNLIEHLRTNNLDVCLGSRFLDEASIDSVPVVRRAGNRFFSILLGYLTQNKFSDVSCGFRCYNKSSVLKLYLSGDFTYTHESIINLAFQGQKFGQVGVSVKYFQDRQSKISGNLLVYAIKTLSIILKVSKDYYPFQVFGIISLLCSSIGLLLFGLFLKIFFDTAVFTGNLYLGFTGASLLMIGLLFFVVAIIMDSLRTQKLLLFKLLYHNKRKSLQQRHTSDC